MNSRIRLILSSSLAATVGIVLGYVSTSIRGTSETASSVTDPAPKTESNSADGLGRSTSVADERFTQILSALREDETLKGRANLFRALANVTAKELPELMERVQHLPLKMRKELVTALFEHWLDVDRATAESWVSTGSRPSSCYNIWARSSPQEALDRSLRPPWINAAWGIAPVALDQMVGKDPMARLKVLTSYPGSASRDGMISSEFGSWAAVDPKSALAWAAKVQDTQLRSALEKKGLISLAKTDPGAAASTIQKMIPELPAGIVGNGFISDFTQGLAKKDITFAREFAENLPPEFQLYPMVAVGSAWAKADPVAALNWALTNGIDVTQLYHTESATTVMSVMLAAMSSDKEKTIDWLVNLPEGNQRDSWLQSVLAENRFKFEPETARTLFEHLSTDRQMTLASTFGRKIGSFEQLADLQARTAWISDENVRARAIGGALASAFNNAPARVEAMLSELPPGAARDQTLSALTRAQTYSTPSEAAVRALTIQDKTVRYDALDRLLNSWMNRDRTTAEAWLDTQTDLPREWVGEWKAIKPWR